MSEKRASTDYPIHQLLAERRIPYALKERDLMPRQPKPLK
jgi:hypothetical protein